MYLCKKSGEPPVPKPMIVHIELNIANLITGAVTKHLLAYVNDPSLLDREGSFT